MSMTVSACSDDSSLPDEDEYYLSLYDYKWTFEGASKSKLTNVFYDEGNLQIFSVRSGDVTDVTSVSPHPEFCKSFKMAEKGHIISMKFSPDMRILSIQRTKHSVDFMEFENGRTGQEFSYAVKGKSGSNATLLRYMWIGDTEIGLVSDQGIRICKVHVANKSVIQIKNFSITVHWFTYFHQHGLLLVNCGNSSHMKLLQMKVDKIVQLTTFEFGEDVMPVLPCPDRDIILGMIYSKPRVLVMSYQNLNGGLTGLVIIYTIIKLTTVKKTHELRLKDPGRFALSLVDNLVVVHNQVSKKSYVYDIGDDDARGTVTYHLPIAHPRSIAPDESSQLYSPNWIFFQPNIVLDAKLGMLTFLELNLTGFIRWISNPVVLIGFLLMRNNSKEVLANTLERIVTKEKNLKTLAQIFDKINQIYRKHLEENLKGQVSLSPNMFEIKDDPNLIFKTVLDQSFVYTFVFSKLADKLGADSPRQEIKSFNWTLLEYIRSLTSFQIPVQDSFYKLLIHTLVINNEFYQLHQLLQYHAIADSKMLACTLLSLEQTYPAALQLAIDMLERLGTAKEEIVEILLSKRQILSALRYAKSHMGPDDKILPAKYIEVAKNSGDSEVYQTVLKHFKVALEINNDRS